MSEPAKGYEVFCDPSYYDLWAARRVGVKSFYETVHFETREDAIRWTHHRADNARKISNP